MISLPNELLCEILDYVEVKDLGNLANVNVLFRRLCTEKLIRCFRSLKVRMVVRQLNKHLCVEFKFLCYKFDSKTIIWETCSSQSQFNQSLLAPSPMVRYLRVSNSNNISSVALSRPITLPVRKNGDITRSGHKKEVVIDYHVGVDGMKVSLLQTELSMFGYCPVPEDFAMNFPPASFTDWLRFQLREPEARCKENARFRKAVPWQPILSNHKDLGSSKPTATTEFKIKVLFNNIKLMLNR